MIPKLIQFMCKLFFILPLKIKKKYRFKCVLKNSNLIVNIIMILSYFYQMIGRSISKFKTAQSTTIITESLALYFISIANIAITTSLIIHKKQFKKCLNKLHLLQSLIGKYLPDYNIEHKIIPLYVIFTLPGTYDTHVQYISTPFEEFKYSVFENLLRIRLAIIILYLYCLIYEIYDAAKAINIILSTLCDDIHNKSILIKTSSQAKNILPTVKDLRRFYRLLEEIVNEFNRVFGFSIFSIIIYLISCFLIAFNLPLTWNKSFHVRRYTIWGVFYMGFGVGGVVLLTSVCRKVSRQLSSTAYLSYALLQRCDSKSKTGKDLYECVKLLLKQATWRYPLFTAGGYFPLDNTTVQLFFTLLVSYVVVLYQFHLIFK